MKPPLRRQWPGSQAGWMRQSKTRTKREQFEDLIGRSAAGASMNWMGLRSCLGHRGRRAFESGKSRLSKAADGLGLLTAAYFHLRARPVGRGAMKGGRPRRPAASAPLSTSGPSYNST